MAKPKTEEAEDNIDFGLLDPVAPAKETKPETRSEEPKEEPQQEVPDGAREKPSDLPKGEEGEGQVQEDDFSVLDDKPDAAKPEEPKKVVPDKSESIKLLKDTRDAAVAERDRLQAELEAERARLAEYGSIEDWRAREAELTAQNNEFKTRLSVLDMENQPEFQDRFNVEADLSTARSILEKMEVSPTFVDRLFAVDPMSPASYKIIGELEDGVKETGLRPGKVVADIQDMIAKAQQTRSDRAAALEDVAGTRERLTNEQRERINAQQQEAQRNAATQAQFIFNELQMQLQTKGHPLADPFFTSTHPNIVQHRSQSTDALRQKLMTASFDAKDVTHWGMIATSSYPKALEVIAKLKSDNAALNAALGGSASPGSVTGPSTGGSGDDDEDNYSFF